VFKLDSLKIKTLILATIMGINGILLSVLNSSEGTIQFLNDSHFMTNNRTVPMFTAEEMNRAEEISSSMVEALRRSGLDLPPLNDSKAKGLNESEINVAQNIIQKSKQLSNLNETN
jgi:hypothetical protein